MNAPWQDTRTAANGKAVQENFARWFAQSVALDESGRPRLLFHGASSDFDEFKPSRGGEYGSGIYLTEDPGSAWMYAERSMAGVTSATGATIYAVYASLQRPYIATTRDWVRSVGVKGLKAKGYDGIIGVGSTGERQIVLFDGPQVKSATGNSGLFLASSASITDLDESKALLQAARAVLATGKTASPERPKMIGRGSP